MGAAAAVRADARACDSLCEEALCIISEPLPLLEFEAKLSAPSLALIGSGNSQGVASNAAAAVLADRDASLPRGTATMLLAGAAAAREKKSRMAPDSNESAAAAAAGSASASSAPAARGMLREPKRSFHALSESLPLQLAASPPASEGAMWGADSEGSPASGTATGRVRRP